MLKRKVGTIIIALLVCLLLFNPTSATYYDKTQSFFDSFESGDYSQIRSNLTEQMREEFDEEGYERFRKSLIKKYGEYQGFEYIDQKGVGGSSFEVYCLVSFKKADVEIKLDYKSVNNEFLINDLTLNGVQRNNSMLLTISLAIFGGIAAIGIFYLLGYKEIKFSDFYFGLGLLFAVLAIQFFIQNSPFYILGIQPIPEALVRGFTFTVFSALWIGISMGLMKQAFRYPFIKNGSLESAAFIGLTFGFVEVLLIYLLGMSPQPTPLSGLAFIGAPLILIHAFLLTLFHGCSTVLIVHAFGKGWGIKALIGLITIQILFDSFAAHYHISGSSLSIIGFFVIIVGGVAFLMYYIMRIRNVHHPLWKEDESYYSYFDDWMS